MKPKPGDRVKVLAISDDYDDESFVGMKGVIIRVCASGLDVGESAEDPGVIVAFHGKGRNLFWREELSAV